MNLVVVKHDEDGTLTPVVAPVCPACNVSTGAAVRVAVAAPADIVLGGRAGASDHDLPGPGNGRR